MTGDFRFMEVTKDGVPCIWITYVEGVAVRGWVVALPVARAMVDGLRTVVEKAEARTTDTPVGVGVTVGSDV